MISNNPVNNFFRVSAEDFKKIPGSPIAYWVGKKTLKIFQVESRLSDISNAKAGMQTGENEVFLRLWNEVDITKIYFNRKSIKDEVTLNYKWFPYNKGGEFKKWYGNMIFVVNWQNNGEEIKTFVDSNNRKKAVVRNEDFYFKKGITWSDVTSGFLSSRYLCNGSIHDLSGHSAFFESKTVHLCILSYLNLQFSKSIAKILNPTLHFQIGNYSKFPSPSKFISNEVAVIAGDNISISKADWDLRETSWDFLRSPLLTGYSAEPIETEIDENLTDISWPSSFGKAAEISSAVESFKVFWKEQFLTLHKNEEELNEIFIELYGLEDELTPDVPYNEITILQEELDPKALKKNQINFKDDEIICQFISYAVGCIFGRYSLDVDGLVLANAGEGVEEYVKRVPEASFMPDESGILPITEEDDFSDDLPSQFRDFLQVSFGEEKYQENLRYIEDVLGKSIRDYLRNNFYKDHVQRYKKRPIYWMITSPSGALKALIYLHRYTKDTINVFLNDYLRPFEQKIDYKIKGLSQVLVSASSSGSEKTKAQKQIDKLNKVKTELENWERDVVYDLAVKRIELDLDDGVKVNYGKLGSVLETVKGLNG